MSRITFRLSEELEVALERYCSAHRVRITDVLVAAIRMFLDRDGLPPQSIAGKLTDLEKRLKSVDQTARMVLEAYGVFIDGWLMTAPDLPKSISPAVEARQKLRHDAFRKTVAEGLLSNEFRGALSEHIASAKNGSNAKDE